MSPAAPNRVSPLKGDPGTDAAEWRLRVQLAAAYRIADHLGWSELIYTHVSLRVPGPEHHFLINPYGLRFESSQAGTTVEILHPLIAGEG